MKKLFTIISAVVVLCISCDRYEEIWDKLKEHEQRIEQLEKQCMELNSNVLAIQTILTAIEQNDYVTDVMKIMEDGVEVGYSITFAKSGTITIYHGTDGTNGTDGTTPKIGVKKASDGAYYWTTGDDWLTDDQGNKIPATVTDPNAPYITPQFRVADGVWYISYDNGNTWRQIEKKEETAPLFQKISYDNDYIYLTLYDGTVITVPTRNLFEQNQNKTSEVRLAKQYDLVVGDTFQLFYTGVVKAFNIQNEGIKVVCKVGKPLNRYYEYTPTEADAGKSYKLKIITRRFDGSVISLGETTLNVHPKLNNASTPSNINVLIFGDSLTGSALWAGEGLRRVYGSDMSREPQSLGVTNTCTTYGTKYSNVNGYPVYHEGYGGWTWASFLKQESINPFYNPENGRVDFNYHANKYANLGADLVAVLLTWNGSSVKDDFDFSDPINKHMNNASTLLRQIHSDFPKAKIICMGIQISSLTGGTSDTYGYAFYSFDYNKALEELVTNPEFGEYCYYVDTKGQFDAEYNMPYAEEDVNNRNDSVTEIVGNNNVHPTTKGYYQIGDAFYRALHRVLPTIETRVSLSTFVDVDMFLSQDASVSAVFGGRINAKPEDLPYGKVTLYYSEGETLDINTAQSISTTTFDDKQMFSIPVDNLKPETTYTYCLRVNVKDEELTGSAQKFTTISNQAAIDKSYTFTYTKWLKNKYVKSDTGLMAGGSLDGQYTMCEDYIPIVANTAYNMTLAGNIRTIRWFAWYDSDKNYISGNDVYTTELVAPANACYLRVTLQAANNGWYPINTQVIDENGYLTSPDASTIKLIEKGMDTEDGDDLGNAGGDTPTQPDKENGIYPIGQVLDNGTVSIAATSLSPACTTKGILECGGTYEITITTNYSGECTLYLGGTTGSQYALKKQTGVEADNPFTITFYVPYLNYLGKEKAILDRVYFRSNQATECKFTYSIKKTGYDNNPLEGVATFKDSTISAKEQRVYGFEAGCTYDYEITSSYTGQMTIYQAYSTVGVSTGSVEYINPLNIASVTANVPITGTITIAETPSVTEATANRLPDTLILRSHQSAEVTIQYKFTKR